MKTRKMVKATLTVLLVAVSLNIQACGKKITANPLAAASTAPVSQMPTEMPIQDPVYDRTPTAAPINATPNAQVGSFKVDQAMLNQWQAKGIAVNGGFIYLTVADLKGLSKKGSVVKMNSSDGKSWKDLGSAWLGLRHPIDSTVEGIAVSGGTILAVDSNSKMYTVDAAKGGVKVIKSSSAKDVASAAGSFYVASGMVEKTDASASSRLPVNGVSASGGVGSDALGNVYVVSGTIIKKIDLSGQVNDVVTSDLTAAIDVAADSRSGDIYVLEGPNVKRFNSNGQLLSTFPSGAIKACSIAVDESGQLYVADTGNTYKDSKVIKFAAAMDATTNSAAPQQSMNLMMSDPTTYSNNAVNSDYAAYSTSRRK